MNPPKWSLKTVKIKELKSHPKNPREISKDQVKQLSKSLDTFGLAEKPIINTDMMIIGGHQRVAILKKKRISEIECWMPDRELTEQEADEFCIRLNKNQGSFDWDSLSSHFDPDVLVEWGFTPQEMEICLDILEPEGDEKEKKGKKKKECPNCGCQF